MMLSNLNIVANMDVKWSHCFHLYISTNKVNISLYANEPFEYPHVKIAYSFPLPIVQYSKLDFLSFLEPIYSSFLYTLD